MTDAAKIHDDKYKAARAEGQPGWGGASRIAKLPQMLEERYFSFDGAPSAGKLLELGCGAGNLSIALSNIGFDVSGVDFSDSAIEWAKENSREASKTIDFRVVDVTNLSCFATASFDVLYDGNCLHCLIGKKRTSALLEWKRVLKPEGLLFISSLCAPVDDPEFPEEFDSTTRVLSEGGIPYRFIPTPEMIESELRAAGFSVARSVVRMDHRFGHINIHAFSA